MTYKKDTKTGYHGHAIGLGCGSLLHQSTTPSKPFHLEKKVNAILTKFANSTKLSGRRDKEDDILQTQKDRDNSGHW